MEFLKKILDEVFEQVTKHNYDTLWIIDGKVRKGKSTLALNIMEYWNKKLNGDTVTEDIKFVCLDTKQIMQTIHEINNSKKIGQMIINDEAGDLSSRRSLSKMNVAVTHAYQVIGALNTFTLFVLPDIFTLDGYFAKQRAYAFLHVYARGRFAFWDRNGLNDLIDDNQFAYRKKTIGAGIRKPLFHDDFNEYNGVLRKGYDLKKKAKINATTEALQKTLETPDSSHGARWEQESQKMITYAIANLRKVHKVKDIAMFFGKTGSWVADHTEKPDKNIVPKSKVII